MLREIIYRTTLPQIIQHNSTFLMYLKPQIVPMISISDVSTYSFIAFNVLHHCI